MKTQTRIMIIATAVLFVLALIPTAYAAGQAKTAKAAKVQAAAKQPPVTVIGTIVANKNAKGKIVSYAVQEEGGQTLMLSKSGKGKELRKMVGAKIEATGTVEESKGIKRITVKEFKKVE
jgi:flagellar basal body-associated protein FliL